MGWRHLKVSYMVYGFDYAFCKLAEPVSDIPITPILYRSETDILKAGTEITVAGFEQTAPDISNSTIIKNQVSVPIKNIYEDLSEILIEKPGKEGCSGDSGDASFVPLPASIDPEQSVASTWSHLKRTR